MDSHNAGRWIAAAAALLFFATYAGDSIAGRAPDESTIVVGGLALLLAPSETGVTAVMADQTTPRFVLAWSWQAPVSAVFHGAARHHRAVAGVDLLLGSENASWRGRVGYRYGGRHAFGGVGVVFEAGGVSLSPEVGVKFAHLVPEREQSIDPSLHLLARTDVAPESGRLRGGTVLLGWNFF
jgi:hypothetical protein